MSEELEFYRFKRAEHIFLSYAQFQVREFDPFYVMIQSGSSLHQELPQSFARTLSFTLTRARLFNDLITEIPQKIDGRLYFERSFV